MGKTLQYLLDPYYTDSDIEDKSITIIKLPFYFQTFF